MCLMDADKGQCAVSLTVGRGGPSDGSFSNNVGCFHLHLRSRGTAMSQLALGAAVGIAKDSSGLL